MKIEDLFNPKIESREDVSDGEDCWHAHGRDGEKKRTKRNVRMNLLGREAAHESKDRTKEVRETRR